MAIFDDPFTFMIECDGEPVAGADNVIAANRAYDALIPQYPSDRILTIRQRGRVLRTTAPRTRD